MLRLYTSLMGASSFVLKSLLKKRLKQGKEDPNRLDERMGIAGMSRPDGFLIWLHAASVGEAQSAMILINALAQDKDTQILVTTGTVTSAEFLKNRLPSNAFHQYYPLDHPKWVGDFLDHWHPDYIIWMESEIWPNMLQAVQSRKIGAALINARLSEKSLRRWKMAGKSVTEILAPFQVCLTQTEDDAKSFQKLGLLHARASGNLKYSAAPLPFDRHSETQLLDALEERPCWVFASTHDSEEEMACRIHMGLKAKVPNLLTIIVPRHPERRENILRACAKYNVNTKQRGDNRALPTIKDDIYLADTLGELGLFYSISPIACIGRSFSNDGGGGHNPIEAAQYHCAVLHGPLVQNLKDIYDEFDKAGACLKINDESDLQKRLEKLFLDDTGREALQSKAHHFVSQKADVLPFIMKTLENDMASARVSKAPKSTIKQSA
jgi:3-deoxy-D-manno-octulosonic-acid transferase